MKGKISFFYMIMKNGFLRRCGVCTADIIFNAVAVPNGFHTSVELHLS